VQGSNGMLERKEKEHGEEDGEIPSEKRNASEEVERLRAKERWMNAVSERDRDTESKKEGRESKNPDTTERMRKFRSTWGEREYKIKKKLWRDLDMGTRTEKTGIGWKERKEGAECVVRRERQLRICGKDVAKYERGRERNGEKY
jgi:hypothetical protein